MASLPTEKRRKTESAKKKDCNGDAADSSKIHHEIAFLGPEGTYGQQAAKQFAKSQSLPEDLEWVPCSTITDAYKRLSKYTVLPLENTIFGPVNETLDCLFARLDYDPEEEAKPFPEQKMIVEALDLPISHCLVVKKGTTQEEIKWVRSHEQALGQSAKFLDGFLPNAKRIPTSSTALAAQSLFTETEPGAALCSKSVVESNPELEVLYEGTQDQKDNYTRFILLVDPITGGQMTPSSGCEKVADRCYSHFFVGHPSAISASAVNLGPGPDLYCIASVHSRPYCPRHPLPKDPRDKYPQSAFWEVVTDNSEMLEEDGPERWIGSASSRWR